MQRDELKIRELKAQLKYIADKESMAREDLDHCRHELKKTKSDCDEKMVALQREKINLHEEKQRVC